MSTSLALEIKKHLQICKLLRQNFRDTKLCLKDLIQSGNFDSEFLAKVAVLRAEDYLITAATENIPTLVLVGNYAASLALVNVILGRSALPETLPHSSAGWRVLRVSYGFRKGYSLSVGNNYEVVDPVLARVAGKEVVPVHDKLLSLMNKESGDPASNDAVLEINVGDELMISGWRILVVPPQPNLTLEVSSKIFTEGILPVFVYSVAGRALAEEDITYLSQLRTVLPHMAALFLCPDGEPLSMGPDSPDVIPSQSAGEVYHQLSELGYLAPPESSEGRSRATGCELVYGEKQLCAIDSFSKMVLHSRLLEVGTCLFSIHERILKMLTTFAFDVARDLCVTPKRLMYVREKETSLFEDLNGVATMKQVEIESIIQQTVESIKEGLLGEVENFMPSYTIVSDFVEVAIPEASQSPKDQQLCAEEIREVVLSKISSAVVHRLMSSLNCLRETVTGTLYRCLEGLELTEDKSHSSAAHALKQIFDAAYQIQLNPATSSSIRHVFYERLRQFVQSLQWSSSTTVNKAWKREIASEMIRSLSASKLAKNILNQFKLKLQQAHELFLTSIRQLEQKHAERLEKVEKVRLSVRRQYAPKMAKLALESASTKDLILHGQPKLGKEIGRGQYGVVFACDSWAGFSPCAIKSIVPPDDSHWFDLSLEYYYTRCVPKHPRIMSFYGSVIDYGYNVHNEQAAVLFVMERMPRDLHSALKCGIPWTTRLQIAIDVIEGIRFLHSQGLVHRDIKLKNVLLDKTYRAKLTDLGFCKPQALLSGSVVGTPIKSHIRRTKLHVFPLAPEIFTGQKYDHSVDIYAFGILLWFLCTGSVKLPAAFEPSMSKDMLRSSVRKGIRPERLPYFDEQCWNMMNACWSSEPYLRPLPGHIEPKLREIHHFYKQGCQITRTIKETEVVVGDSGGSPYCHLDFVNTVHVTTG